EWLGKECMLAKGDLNGVKQLDNQQDQQDAVEQADCARLAGQHALCELDDGVDQKSEGAGCKEQPEADVDDILHGCEGAGDPGTDDFGFTALRCAHVDLGLAAFMRRWSASRQVS